MTTKTTKAAKASAKAAPAVPPDTPFEDALGELESIVRGLESGDLSLEDSLARFERGVALSRFCRQSLAEAEQKVRVLLDDDAGGESLEDFEPEAAP